MSAEKNKIEQAAPFIMLLMDYFETSEAYWNGHPDMSCEELEKEREEIAAELHEQLNFEGYYESSCEEE